MSENIITFLPRAGQYLNSNKNVEVEQYQNLRFLQSPTRLLLTKRTSTFFFTHLVACFGQTLLQSLDSFEVFD